MIRCPQTERVPIRYEVSAIFNTRNILLRATGSFSPGSFSFIMATGVISLAVHQQHMETVSSALFVANQLAFAVLAVLAVLRGILHPAEMLADLTEPSRTPALFTIPAGTCILGSEMLLYSGAVFTGTVLWIAGFLLWAVFCYAFFTALITRQNKAGAEEELSGEWLLVAVGVQSVTILGILLAPHAGLRTADMLLASLCLHLTGTVLYVVFIILIVRRLLFLELSPAQFTPPYWITMGAAAISTLAGAELMLQAGGSSVLRELLPPIEWVTLLLWAVATWWIPLVAALNIWRYGLRRYPFSYDIQQWSMVFPFGMYTACTFQLGKAAKLPLLSSISRYFVYVAMAAWIVTFLGMSVNAIRKLRSPCGAVGAILCEAGHDQKGR